jgi:2-polyprenyl-3-methyl-5-hydroxy-6-metoxy-1,4-benzoquinol methylase
MEEPVALAHVAIHDTVENILRDAPRGRLLDVPAGEGALAKRLIELGFDVACCDLYPQIFKLGAAENKKGDLDGELPYDAASFDHIVCVEGLEHIENPANAIREFSKLLRPQGNLIVSVPNIMNIEERLKWLFSGYTSHFKPLSIQAREKIARDFGGIEEVALHVNPISYSEVRYLLETNGFAIEKLFADKPKKNTFAFAPITALIRLISKFSSENKRNERWTDELNSKEVLTGGNTLIFKARKI